MTIGTLWLPSLCPAQSIILRASGGATTGALTNPTYVITLPSSYTTRAHDCIVLAVCVSGGGGVWATPGVSGCGATWDQIVVPAGGAAPAPTLALFIGYGCSAGGTTVTISGLPSFIDAPWAMGVWSGIKSSSDPLSSSNTGTSGTGNASAVTTGSVSYAPDNLVVGCGGGQGFSWVGNAVWSDGGVNNLIASPADAASATYLSYRAIPGASSSTTYTPASDTFGGFTGKVRSAAATLLPT